MNLSHSSRQHRDGHHLILKALHLQFRVILKLAAVVSHMDSPLSSSVGGSALSGPLAPAPSCPGLQLLLPAASTLRAASPGRCAPRGALECIAPQCNVGVISRQKLKSPVCMTPSLVPGSCHQAAAGLPRRPRQHALEAIARNLCLYRQTSPAMSYDPHSTRCRRSRPAPELLAPAQALLALLRGVCQVLVQPGCLPGLSSSQKAPALAILVTGDLDQALRLALLQAPL